MKTAVFTMRDVGQRFALDTEVMRLLTSIPVPLALARYSTSVSPAAVKIFPAQLGPGMPLGEWYVPATTQHDGLGRMRADTMFNKDQRVILYLHGGAMVLCSHKTHREMLLRLVGKTGMMLLAIDYRRPPEHPWPVPVDDCFNVYELLANLHTNGGLTSVMCASAAAAAGAAGRSDDGGGDLENGGAAAAGGGGGNSGGTFDSATVKAGRTVKVGVSVGGMQPGGSRGGGDGLVAYWRPGETCQPQPTNHGDPLLPLFCCRGCAGDCQKFGD
jgi:hypothetical protein